MPTYDYRCKECGHELEVTQSFTDDPLEECPACGGRLRKKFAAPGIAFKGSGFYKTDSRTAGTSSKSSSGTGGNGGKTEAASKDSNSSSTGSSDSSGSSGSSSGDKSPAST